MEELASQRRKSLLPLKFRDEIRMGICTDTCVGRQRNLNELVHG